MGAIESTFDRWICPVAYERKQIRALEHDIKCLQGIIKEKEKEKEMLREGLDQKRQRFLQTRDATLKSEIGQAACLIKDIDQSICGIFNRIRSCRRTITHIETSHYTKRIITNIDNLETLHNLKHNAKDIRTLSQHNDKMEMIDEQEEELNLDGKSLEEVGEEFINNRLIDQMPPVVQMRAAKVRRPVGTLQ